MRGQAQAVRVLEEAAGVLVKVMRMAIDADIMIPLEGRKRVVFEA
jgi:hypothetical protein